VVASDAKANGVLKKLAVAKGSLENAKLPPGKKRGSKP